MGNSEENEIANTEFRKFSTVFIIWDNQYFETWNNSPARTKNKQKTGQKNTNHLRLKLLTEKDTVDYKEAGPYARYYTVWPSQPFLRDPGCEQKWHWTWKGQGKRLPYGYFLMAVTGRQSITVEGCHWKSHLTASWLVFISFWGASCWPSAVVYLLGMKHNNIAASTKTKL